MQQDPAKRRALGRGLDSLLPGGPPRPQVPLPAAPALPVPPARDPVSARIEELTPGAGQPRHVFDDEKLEELAQSIRELGVLEPILVRKKGGNEPGFHIIAGERRWRAAQRAGLFEVPIVVRELTDAQAFEAALVENIQRADLNPIETARAFQRLLDEHKHTQETLAARVGKDRSTVANALRLLKLPEAVLDLVETGQLSEGHGRALLAAGDPNAMLKLARSAVEKGWSVRETERAARFISEVAKNKDKPEKSGKSVNTRDLETRLAKSLGSKVAVADRNGKGNIQIHFTSYDELDRLLEKFFS
ncbi:MAG: Chromosome (plasmid) partitioning protein ParB [Myxococcaceae bacterium]|nr:Chromosome (plasmid) partitioning protein ParB [Myxococcaceae bacterium]